MQTTIQETIPSFDTLDFSEAGALEAYAHLLFSIYKYEGGFENKISKIILRRLREEAEKWVLNVERNIGLFTAEEIQQSLSNYDTMHRLAFSKAPKKGFYDQWMSRALLKTAQGDKADRVVFMYWILDRLNHNPYEVADNHYRWYISLAGRWENEFTPGIKAFSKETEADTLRIIDFLLRQEITNDLPGSISKYSLAETGLSHTRQIIGNEGSPSSQLRDAANFVLHLQLVNQDYPSETLRQEILKKLIGSPDSHPYKRKAWQLDYLYEFHS